MPAPPEEFAADLAARLGEHSVRQLASISGWGRTTVADIRAGRQLPTPDQLRDLLMSVGADTDEVAAWQARREAIAPAPLQTPAPPPTPAPLHTPEPTRESASAPEDAATDDRTPRRRLGRLLAGLVAALLLLATGFAGGYAVRGRTLQHAVDLSSATTTGPVSGARSRVARVVQGATHTCALTEGGAVWCWGRDDVGQLGDGKHTATARPVQVTGLLADVIDIAAGGRTTCAITYARAVRCWGHNAYGQLGDGKEVHQTVPVAVRGLPGPIAKVAVGTLHVCALTTGGDAYCWGNDEHGQLGIGTIARNVYEPTLVKGIGEQLADIVAGSDFTCAYSIRREVYCWGANAHGQLGIGTREDSAKPVRLTAYPLGVSALAAGAEHACAIAPAGGVDCWGRGDLGQLGDGRSTDSSVPVPAKGLDSGFVHLTAGSGHSCAASATGEVSCWGDGRAGQLGLGLGQSTAVPVTVPDVHAGGLGLSAAAESTCALDTEALWCWGSSRYGEIGAGAAESLARPHRIPIA